MRLHARRVGKFKASTTNRATPELATKLGGICPKKDERISCLPHEARYTVWPSHDWVYRDLLGEPSSATRGKPAGAAFL